MTHTHTTVRIILTVPHIFSREKSKSETFPMISYDHVTLQRRKLNDPHVLLLTIEHSVVQHLLLRLSRGLIARNKLSLI